MSILLSRATLICGLTLGSVLLSAGLVSAQDDGKVVATVNGQAITEAELAIAEQDLDQQFSRLPEEQRRAAAVSAIVEIRLLSDKAKADGLDKDPTFQRRMAFLQQRALHSAVVEAEVANKVTDEEIKARYEKDIAENPPPEQIKARHILVKTKEEAEAIIKDLDNGGDFEKLANEHTNDPSGKTNGGDLGYFSVGQMVPEFEKAAMALETGTYTKEPVQTQFGFHVIKVEDRRPQPAPELSQVKDHFRSLVLRDKYFALVKSLRDKAKVEIADAELKKAVDALEKSAEEQR